ncbi:hypothetical protein QAD02_010809 [Eretmocerus hayati]|uniref:Uncharacterized protein n=1 Tax=Eretmocerus hayati TaxID=131215 RepID=A0ACC2NUY6_9HYME|nr:hypothetical protein QAD02_010809 [Eretmocerus hayati]
MPCIILAFGSILAMDGYFIMVVQHACSKFAILRFVDLIEQEFSFLWFVQLVPNSISISLTGVHVLNLRDDPQEMAPFVVLIMGMIVRMTYMSWPGQKINNHSTDMWYTL